MATKKFDDCDMELYIYRIYKQVQGTSAREVPAKLKSINAYNRLWLEEKLRVMAVLKKHIVNGVVV